MTDSKQFKVPETAVASTWVIETARLCFELAERMKTLPDEDKKFLGGRGFHGMHKGFMRKNLWDFIVAATLPEPLPIVVKEAVVPHLEKTGAVCAGVKRRRRPRGAKGTRGID